MENMIKKEFEHADSNICRYEERAKNQIQNMIKFLQNLEQNLENCSKLDLRGLNSQSGALAEELASLNAEIEKKELLSGLLNK